MMRGSKVFMHRMLEQARVPTIWTVNDANDLPDTVLRRMSYALKLSVPGMTVRKRIWKKAFEAADLNPAQGKVEKLAIEFAEAPALSATAVRVARLVGGDFDVARRSISGISRVMHGQVQPARTKPSCFEPSLINANMDVEAIARRLQAADAIPAFSLLVSGPPGTGKTEWVQHLAETLGIEVLSYRASDLLSPYVGETEKAIADAFADARETNRFLVFDEADSLLQDRRFAHASWQVSQVNELLTWMESHPLPFAMTTNLPEGLDQASLRRFVFKLKFDYLRPDQRGQAFHHFFGQEAPAELSALDNLTPGDLAIVKRRLSILGSNETDAHTIMSMLREECEGKPDFSRPIGFAAPAQKLAAA
jgi:transitional endoplasmic reticulum ATPase